MPRLLTLIVVVGLALPSLAKEKADPAADFFDPLALHSIHLKLTQKAWDEMQPTRPGFLSNLFEKPSDKPQDKKRSPFGLEYTYVHATVEADGKTLKDVGLRFKGNSSYTTTERLLKRPYKIDFNRYDDAQKFLGLTTLNLHNNALDPSFSREALTYELFRRAGVPAPRTTWALVYLTVEGKYDKQLVGLYTPVEEVGKAFLRAHFGSAKGLLLKPENALNLPYMGEDFAKYEKVYRPHTETTPATTKRLIDFTKLLHQADDATFAKSIGDYLDLPGFEKFIAVNSVTCNMDSFLCTWHNFFMYVHPDTGKIHFIPWDLNLSLGAFTWVAADKQMLNLSIAQPWVGPHKLLDRLAKLPEFNEGLRKAIAEVNHTAFAPKELGPRIEAMRAVVAKAQKLAFGPGSATQPTTKPENTAAGMVRWLGMAPDLKDFNEKRWASVEGQLAGTVEGHVPTFMQRGPAPKPAGDVKAGAATKPAVGPATRPAAGPTTRPVEVPARK